MKLSNVTDNDTAEPEDAPEEREGAVEAADPATQEQRRLELESLFDSWAQRREDELSPALTAGAEMSRRSRDPIVWRGVFSALIVLLSVGLITFTYDDFMYWVEAPEQPQDLGHVGERYIAGDTDLGVTSNSYVKVSGMFLTHELQAVGSKEDEKGEDVADETSRKYFICPLYDIVVQTTQPLPDKAWGRNVSIDGAFIDLINRRRAFPQDLTVTIDGAGRMFKLKEAPEWARRMVRRWYLEQLRVSVDPDKVLFFMDGETPDKYSKYAYFWGFAAIAPIIPLLLLFRALRRRKKDLEAIAAEGNEASASA